MHKQAVESDPSAQLESRLDALYEHGLTLRQAVHDEDQGPAEVSARGAARAAYKHNLEERQRLRAKRDEAERSLEMLGRHLYAKWRELRQIRVEQGFSATPWKLRVQPQERELHADTARRSRNLDAEAEEVVYLQQVPWERARADAEYRWDATKRATGSPILLFSLQASEETTPEEILKTRANGDAVREDEAQAAAEELQRRRLLQRLRVRVLIKVGDRVVGYSPSYVLHPETWSTQSAYSLAGSPRSPTSPSPLHSFDLAVHVMPRSVSVVVQVHNGFWFSRWWTTSEAEIDIPDQEGRRVTHAPLLDQQLPFGVSLQDALIGPKTVVVEEDEHHYRRNDFSGHLCLSVSWPGAGMGFVVPPPDRTSAATSAGIDLSHALCLPCSPAERHSSHSRAPKASDAATEEHAPASRLDPHDPETLLLLKSRPAVSQDKAGNALDRSDAECKIPRRPMEKQCTKAVDVGPERFRRIEKLVHRAEREGIDAERNLIPALERELPRDQDEFLADLKGSHLQNDHQREFIRRVRARVKKVGTVKTHLSYKSIVREHGAEEEEQDLWVQLEKLAELFMPSRPLRPSGGERKMEVSAKQVRIHISLAKVYAAPVRCHDPNEGKVQQMQRPAPLTLGGSMPYGQAGWGGGFQSQGFQQQGFQQQGFQPQGFQQQGFLQQAQPQQQGGMFGALNFGGFGGGAAGGFGGGGFSPRGVGQQVGYGTQSAGFGGFSLAPPMMATSGPVFGAPAHGLPKEVLPQIVVEMCLEDLEGVLHRRRSNKAGPSTDPDVNQILEVPLRAATQVRCSKCKDLMHDLLEVPSEKKCSVSGCGYAVKLACKRTACEYYLCMEHSKALATGMLTQETLMNYDGNLTLNIFDEITLAEPERGGETRLRHQRRHLGRFVLPWSTLYSSRCSIKGHFRVEQPPLIFGYRPKPKIRQEVDEATGEATNIQEADTEVMSIGVDITVDPALAPPERVQSAIVRGKEPTVILKQVQQWMDAFKHRPDLKASALGTDMDGHSRLVCRFVRPQKPPAHIDPADPFAIEAAARYVCLIPFLRDNDMFPSVEDLWCSDQEFLNIRAGDWEEHCILLCNYFNYIDRYRKETVPGYSDTNIQSYCVLCDLALEGEAMMVLRRDLTTGHCEFWNASSGDCFFIPLIQMQKVKMQNVLRRSTTATSLDASLASSGSLQATSSPPMRRVHVIFNSDNVWANLQSPARNTTRGGLSGIKFDLTDSMRWRPLFAGGRAELRKLSGIHVQEVPEGAPEPPDPAFDYRLEDVNEAIKYEDPDERHATSLVGKFESQLEQQIVQHRSMGEHGGVQHSTKFNRVIGDRLGELLEELEKLTMCRRRTGLESVFPLRSQAMPPVTREAVERRMHEIESDFRMLGRKRRSVFGVPINQPYTDFRHIWEAVRDTRILELGGDEAEYALKVRVFPYASGVLSVWVFIVCAIDSP